MNTAITTQACPVATMLPGLTIVIAARAVGDLGAAMSGLGASFEERGSERLDGMAEATGCSAYEVLAANGGALPAALLADYCTADC